jgi:hypothetical protein
MRERAFLEKALVTYLSYECDHDSALRREMTQFVPSILRRAGAAVISQ